MKDKLRVKKTQEKMIGALRVSPEVFDKIKHLAKQEKVSNQAIIRAILEQFIDRIY